MKRVCTEALLPFPPEQVWRMLCDFDRYREWNPLNVDAAGAAVVGARIPMQFVNPVRPGTTVRQTVRIVAAKTNRHLAWRGHVPILFTGLHFFDLASRGRHTCLRHGEVISGLFGLAISDRTLTTRFVPAYAAVNQALEERVAAILEAGLT